MEGGVSLIAPDGLGRVSLSFWYRFIPLNLGMSGKTNKPKGNLLTGSDKVFSRIKNPDPPIKN
jgi:hypothetical protein